MRELKIADLPPAHDTGRCKVVTAECGSAFTQCRHGIKDKVSNLLLYTFPHTHTRSDRSKSQVQN